MIILFDIFYMMLFTNISIYDMSVQSGNVGIINLKFDQVFVHMGISTGT